MMNKKEIERAVRGIAEAILRKNKDVETLAVIGIRRRGEVIARRIAEFIRRESGIAVDMGSLDITLYRDDFSVSANQPVLQGTEIDFDITNKAVILVDDVLYTGRTVRCALDELIDFGRPGSIQLAVLIDRGRRELPVCADFVGKKVETKKDEVVEVFLDEVDGREEVVWRVKD